MSFFMYFLPWVCALYELHCVTIDADCHSSSLTCLFASVNNIREMPSHAAVGSGSGVGSASYFQVGW